MTTLYEHKLLGSKIYMISANFNIPFLNGDGNICLYEFGITLLDKDGNEKYILELNGFEVEYEKFINIRNLKYLDRAKVFLKNINSAHVKMKNLPKCINKVFYGKLIIFIPQVGDIVLFDNQSLKYRNFYDKIQLLKNGINPLYNSNNTKKSNIMNIFKLKFGMKNHIKR